MSNVYKGSHRFQMFKQVLIDVKCLYVLTAVLNEIIMRTRNSSFPPLFKVITRSSSTGLRFNSVDNGREVPIVHIPEAKLSTKHGICRGFASRSKLFYGKLLELFIHIFPS